MRIRAARIVTQRSTVRADRRCRLAEIFERDAEVECSDGIVGARRERAFVQRTRFFQIARLVLQAAEVHERIGVLWVGRDRLLVRVACGGGIGDLDLAAPREPLVGGALGARVFRARLRSALARLAERRGVEVEECLPVGFEHARAVAHDEETVSRGDMQRRERTPDRQSIAQPAQRRTHATMRDLAVDERLRRAQEHEVLKRKAQRAALTALRREKSRAHVRTHFADRKSDQLGDLLRAVPERRHERRCCPIASRPRNC